MPDTAGRYRAGMPQLASTGLSENWLLKECGHRHWEALAADTGRPAPDFTDDDGGKAYAAFTAVQLRGAMFGDIQENDSFEIATQLCRTGGARHFSTHCIRAGDAVRGTVSMSSTFIRR